MNTLITLWQQAPWSAVACFALAALIGLCILALFVSRLLDPMYRARREERRQFLAARRQRRRNLRIRVSAQELERHREVHSVRTHRGFMRAFRESHGL